ncbi:MAG: diguanylate cyclase [Myxococcota bacterium]
MDERILVVGDDQRIGPEGHAALVREGYEVACVPSGAAALDHLEQKGAAGLLIADLSLPEMESLQLLERLRREHPELDVIVTADEGAIDRALRALRLGAANYLRRPFATPELIYCVQRTLQRRRLLAENESLRGSVQALETARALSGCLETHSILPLSLDVIRRLLGRRRAVGRWAHPLARPGEGATMAGFGREEAGVIRDEIERGKLFDPHALEGPERRGPPPAVQEGLARIGIEHEELMALPLRRDRRVVGGIWVFSDGRPFTPDEWRAGAIVATQAELAFANAERFLEARERAFIDDVTELYNARYLLAALDREVQRAERASLELSVLFLDLDRFKLVNDQHGHLVGSHVLRELGRLLQDSIRTIDTIARYGGDEFCMILVDTGAEGAMSVAERIRRSTEEARFGAEHGLSLALTVCVGVATFPQHGATRETLLDQADKAMYLGKSLGRNRVCSAQELHTGRSAGL